MSHVKTAAMARNESGVTGWRGVQARTAQVYTVDLVNGPGDGGLADAYRYAYNPAEGSDEVVFVGADGLRYYVQITGLVHEDGSGHSHLFAGNLRRITTTSGRPRPRPWAYVKGAFNTNASTTPGRRRSGAMTLSTGPLSLVGS